MAVVQRSLFKVGPPDFPTGARLGGEKFSDARGTRQRAVLIQNVGRFSASTPRSTRWSRHPTPRTTFAVVCGTTSTWTRPARCASTRPRRASSEPDVPARCHFRRILPASRTRPRHLTPPAPPTFPPIADHTARPADVRRTSVSVGHEPHRSRRVRVVRWDARLPSDPRRPRAPRRASSAPSRSSTTAPRPPSPRPRPRRRRRVRRENLEVQGRERRDPRPGVRGDDPRVVELRPDRRAHARVDRRHARLCTPPRRPRTLPRHLRRRRSRRFHRANHPPVDDGGHGGGGGGGGGGERSPAPLDDVDRSPRLRRSFGV